MTLPEQAKIVENVRKEAHGEKTGWLDKVHDEAAGYLPDTLKTIGKVGKGLVAPLLSLGAGGAVGLTHLLRGPEASLEQRAEGANKAAAKAVAAVEGSSPMKFIDDRLEFKTDAFKAAGKMLQPVGALIGSGFEHVGKGGGWLAKQLGAGPNVQKTVEGVTANVAPFLLPAGIGKGLTGLKRLKGTAGKSIAAPSENMARATQAMQEMANITAKGSEGGLKEAITKMGQARGRTVAGAEKKPANTMHKAKAVVLEDEPGAVILEEKVAAPAAAKSKQVSKITEGEGGVPEVEILKETKPKVRAPSEGDIPLEGGPELGAPKGRMGGILEEAKELLKDTTGKAKEVFQEAPKKTKGLPKETPEETKGLPKEMPEEAKGVFKEMPEAVVQEVADVPKGRMGRILEEAKGLLRDAAESGPEVFKHPIKATREFFRPPLTRLRIRRRTGRLEALQGAVPKPSKIWQRISLRQITNCLLNRGCASSRLLTGG